MTSHRITHPFHDNQTRVRFFPPLPIHAACRQSVNEPVGIAD